MSDIVETARARSPRPIGRGAARGAPGEGEAGKAYRRVLEPRRVGRRDRGARGRGEKHMRALVRDILARRMPEPRAQFFALQVSRLEEALLVSLGAMSGSNLQAVDRVSRSCASSIAITVSSQQSAGAFRVASEAPEEIAPWLEAHIAKRSRPQMAPQRLEKIESAPGNGMAPEAPDPQDMVQSATAPRRLSPPPTKPLARSRRRRPAREWSRKSSRRLNPRPEMVWLRKARAPRIWRRRANHSSAQPPQSRAAPDGSASG